MQLCTAIFVAVSTVLSARLTIRCEPVATYMGSGAEPEWILACVNPCAQGCWNPTPTEYEEGVMIETCACVGGYPDPWSDCCRYWLMYIDGVLVGPVGLGNCGDSCPEGDYCGTYWIDEVTGGAKCDDY